MMKATVRPVYRERLHDRITRDLALNIIRGHFGAHQGAVFTETDIARQMSVSRTALRESVKVLAAKGLLSVRPKTGLRVCPRENWNLLDPELLAWLCETGLDDVLIRDLCEVRLLIEPAAAELAAARATQDEIEGILACCRQMQQNSHNASIYDPLDVDFHTRIFKSCHNAFITNMRAMMLETLRATQNVARRVHNVVIDKSWPLHGEVAKAIQERDCGAARLSMERIVRQAARDISLSLNVKVAQFTDVTFKGGTPLVAAFQPNGSASKPRGLSGLQPQEREEKRTDAVRLVESGVSPEQVAKEFGINRTTIYDWLSRYKVAGPAGLRSKISLGRPSKLTSARRESVIAKLEGYSPSLIGSSSPLWTDASVRDLLRIEFSTNLSLSSVRRFLVSLGPRPKRFLLQLQDSIPEWRTEKYPKILEQSKKLRAEILFEESQEVHWQHSHGSDDEKEEERTLKERQRKAPRRHYYFLSAINTRGAAKFLVVGEKLTDERYLNFLTGLLDSSERPLILVRLDHHADLGETVTSYLERNAARLKVFNIPSPV